MDTVSEEKRRSRFVVKLFGVQAERAGRREVEVAVESAGEEGAVTAGALCRALAEGFPALRDSIGGSRLAADAEFVADDARVKPTQEIALIGLVGGG